MLTHRIVFSDNGSLTDYSLQNISIPAVFTAAQDYYYISQRYPFTSIYIQIGTANTNSSVLSAEYWNGSAWTACVDLLDETSLSGKTLAQSGIVRWALPSTGAWLEVDDTSLSNITELQTLSIYDSYWMRLKVSANTSATSAISRIGYCFTDSTQLTSLDADINEYLTSWSASKTDWIDQMVQASVLVVIDLKSKSLIKSSAQLLQIDEEIKLLTAYRTLMLIYPNLGEKYGPKLENVRKEYDSILTKIQPIIDSNEDGHNDESENGITLSRAVR